jgi:hypothetical protein
VYERSLPRGLSHPFFLHSLHGLLAGTFTALYTAIPDVDMELEVIEAAVRARIPITSHFPVVDLAISIGWTVVAFWRDKN